MNTSASAIFFMNFTIFKALLLRLVDVSRLRHFAIQIISLQTAVYVFVPQQGTTSTLFRFQSRFIGFEFVDEQGGVRLVIGAAEK
jgi:hypothetical protein